jgi:hypothetical protein
VLRHEWPPLLLVGVLRLAWDSLVPHDVLCVREVMFLKVYTCGKQTCSYSNHHSLNQFQEVINRLHHVHSMHIVILYVNGDHVHTPPAAASVCPMAMGGCQLCCNTAPTGHSQPLHTYSSIAEHVLHDYTPGTWASACTCTPLQMSTNTIHACMYIPTATPRPC